MKRKCDFCRSKNHKKAYVFFTKSNDMPDLFFKHFPCSVQCALMLLERQIMEFKHFLVDNPKGDKRR